MSPDDVTANNLRDIAHFYGEPYDTIIAMLMRLDHMLKRLEDLKLEDFSGRISSLEEWRDQAKFRITIGVSIITAIIGVIGGYLIFHYLG